MEPLLALRARRPDLQQILYCSSSFSGRPVTPRHSVQEAIRASGDKNYIRLALGWLGKSGPFWESERYPNPEDYFQYDGTDVTDQGLGEAARRIIAEVDSGTFSFLDAEARFSRSPLIVIQGLDENPLARIEVRNFWTIAALEDVFDTAPESWKEMLEQADSRFDRLDISPDVIGNLERQPFNRGISSRVGALLSVLNRLARESHEDQSFTRIGMEILQSHFVGQKAPFSDESETNKRAFKGEMTFRDPRSGASIFCPWHGKIKINQFRIHFEWPRPKGQTAIRVFYIGPKITVT
jgi:hypothetical protein